MTNPTTVAQAMTEDVVTAEPGETLAAVAERMRAHRVGSAVVVERNHPVGIVTERDLLRADGRRRGARRRRRSTTGWPPSPSASSRTVRSTRRGASWPSAATATSPWSVGDELKGIISIRDLMALAQLRPADEPPRRGAGRAQGRRRGRDARSATSAATEGFYHYRQYAAPELAAKRTFEDVVHLLIDGELPTLDERAAFAAELAPLRHLPPDVLAALPAIAASVTDARSRRCAPRSRCSPEPRASRRRSTSTTPSCEPTRCASPPRCRRSSPRCTGCAAAIEPIAPRDDLALRGQLPLHGRRHRAGPASGPARSSST